MSNNAYIAPALGVGAYAIPEAARYLRIGPGRLRSWFVSSEDRASAFLSDFKPVEGSTAISFYDLIDAQVAVQLRDMNLSMQRVRRVYNAMQHQYGMKHPFCSRQLYTDGRDVFLKSAQTVEDPNFVDVLSSQHYFDEVLAPFLSHIDYDKAAGMAQRWRIHDNVVIDPRVSFGKPVIEGSRVSTYIIAREYVANHQDAELVANLYTLSTQQVLSAYEFERDINLLKAA